MSVLKSQRIEYIDAMRGFTMLLVVMAHVSMFCLGLYGYNGFSFNKMLSEFRMPLFFFVSGFVLFKSNYCWNLKNIGSFLRKKIVVQIVTPTFFFLVSIYLRELNLMDSICSPTKEGYWFTYALFEYFLLYIAFHCILDIVGIKGIWKDILLLLFSFLIYLVGLFSGRLPFDMQVLNAIGVAKWQYFIYFMMGNRLRKHFARFEQLLDGSFVVSLAVLLFFSFNIFQNFFWNLSNSLFNLLTALSGLLLVVAFFRKNADIFSSENTLGRVFQYVGKRTLDIYLIHYYIIFSNLKEVLPDFSHYNEPFSELLVSFVLSVIIIAFCLLISNVLRLSPFIAHCFFGKK